MPVKFIQAVVAPLTKILYTTYLQIGAILEYIHIKELKRREECRELYLTIYLTRYRIK